MENLSYLRADIVRAIGVRDRERIANLIEKAVLIRGTNETNDLSFLLDGEKEYWIAFYYINRYDMMYLFIKEERKQKLSHSCFMA
jgi:hypothetical protein